MPQFRYSTVEPNGTSTDGVIEASSLHDASAKLRAAEINAVSITGVSSETRRFEPDGPRPGDTPRDVTLSIRDMPGGLTVFLLGAIFAGIAAPLVVGGVILADHRPERRDLSGIVPLIHLSIGVAILIFIFGRRKRWHHVYRHGAVAMAAVTGVGFNRTVRVNGKNPRELAWSFELEGHTYHDKKSSFDPRIASFVPGDRIWVVYDPEDPEESLEWPPFKG